MSSTFTRAQIASLASLAQLDLDEAEQDLFARQLGEFLEYARQIQQIDTTAIPATASVVTSVESDRADERTPSLAREDALQNAPDAAPGAGLFRVPRVIG
jgi:aspartyl-tRNA(Asn)/glutamyl-tRNA(Gln) amidotransferase subunit C